MAKPAGYALVLGWGSLMIYVLLDHMRSGEGNPIGLGLFAVAITFLVIVLLSTDELIKRSQRRRLRHVNREAPQRIESRDLLRQFLSCGCSKQQLVRIAYISSASYGSCTFRELIRTR